MSRNTYYIETYTTDNRRYLDWYGADSEVQAKAQALSDFKRFEGPSAEPAGFDVKFVNNDWDNFKRNNLEKYA